MLKQVLVREAPNKEPEEFDWNVETQQRFELNSADVAELEEDRILWRGDVAFYLDVGMEVM